MGSGNQNAIKNAPTAPQQEPLSKSAQLLKQQKLEAKRAKKKAFFKEKKKKAAERKRKELLAGNQEQEKKELVQSRKSQKKEMMEKAWEERSRKIERLTASKQKGQNVVIDLEFGHLMAPKQIQGLVQQVTDCYAMNGRCASPCHLWLTGYNAEMEGQLQKRGFDKWIIEKEKRPYIEALQDHKKKNLVYLTADSETVLDKLDPKKFYIVGGLVDQNRWKGITMKKAKEQGIKTAKLPIGDYMKMSSTKVLTVNQVVEIVVKFSETRDWKTSFFQVIPQRKRGKEGEVSDERDRVKVKPKKQRIKAPSDS